MLTTHAKLATYQEKEYKKDKKAKGMAYLRKYLPHYSSPGP
jgi:hypothetical protein